MVLDTGFSLLVVTGSNPVRGTLVSRFDSGYSVDKAHMPRR